MEINLFIDATQPMDTTGVINTGLGAFALYL